MPQSTYNVTICGHFQSFNSWAIKDKSLRSEDFPVYETLHRIGQFGVMLRTHENP